MAYLNNGVAVIQNNGNVTANSIVITANAREFVGVTGAEFDVPNDVFQGSVSGYVSGGFANPTTYTNVIDKYPFSSDSNATDVGDMSGGGRSGPSGQSSGISGYVTGGFNSAFATINTIEKFPFASDTNTTGVGRLSIATNGCSGTSSSEHGYSGGGSSGSTNQASIQKFPFATDLDAIISSDLTIAKTQTSGQSSTTHGYASGGGTVPSITIEKYSFSIDSNATDVGDLTTSHFGPSGQSSSTHGYASGGQSAFAPPVATFTNVIDKFPFASDTNATDIGDLLTNTARRQGGNSSTTNGYATGDVNSSPPFVTTNVIEKFPYATDTNSTDVGDLTQGRYNVSGQQARTAS